MRSIVEIIESIPALYKEFNGKQIEREEATSFLIMAFFAHKNLMMVGVPGTNKTGSLEVFSTILEDGKVFHTTIKDDTTYEELFGDRFKDESGKLNYCTDDSVVDANIAIIDEIGKGNSKILNSLLSATSDYRIVEIRGRGRVKIPNISTFSASNEFSLDEGLEALHDRFHVRLKIEPIETDENWLRYIAKDFDTEPRLKTTYTRDEVKLVYSHIKKVIISDGINRKLLEIKNAIQNLKISCSARRFSGSIEILKSCALLNGRDEVEITDLFILKNTLWEKEEDIDKVLKVLNIIVFGNVGNIEQCVAINESQLQKCNTLRVGQYEEFLNFRRKYDKSEEHTFNNNIKAIEELLNSYKTCSKGYDSLRGHCLYNNFLSKSIKENLFLPDYKDNIYNSSSINLNYLEIQIELISDAITNIEEWLNEYSKLYIYNNRVSARRAS